MSTPSSLLQHITATECLNQDTEFGVEGLINGTGPLKSDCDEQIILNFGFGSPAKTQGLVFRSTAGNEDHRPSQVRVFLNERNVIFGNVNALVPREEVTLKWEVDAEGNAKAVALLPKCRYMAAAKLTLFIMGNEGDEDVTIVDGIDLLGELAAGVGTSELPKKEG